MKTCDLKLGDIVRYKGNSGYYMDMTVVAIEDNLCWVWRPFIWLNEDGTVDLKAEKTCFHVTSNMEWEVKSRRPDLELKGSWMDDIGVSNSLVVPNL